MISPIEEIGENKKWKGGRELVPAACSSYLWAWCLEDN